MWYKETKAKNSRQSTILDKESFSLKYQDLSRNRHTSNFIIL